MIKILTSACITKNGGDFKILTSLKKVVLPRKPALFLTKMGQVQNGAFHKKVIALVGGNPSFVNRDNLPG